MQTAEQKESKKRKGASKDGINKSKKPKKGEKEGGLTLNAAATTVEILHIKVMDWYIRSPSCEQRYSPQYSRHQ